MPSVSVELRNIAGTEAALGWAGAHTVVIDRPEGRAGGRGLGFNGAQLLALTIGGCFCNDLRYVAHATGVELGAISVSATVELEGEARRSVLPRGGFNLRDDRTGGVAVWDVGGPTGDRLRRILPLPCPVSRHNYSNRSSVARADSASLAFLFDVRSQPSVSKRMVRPAPLSWEKAKPMHRQIGFWPADHLCLCGAHGQCRGNEWACNKARKTSCA